MCLKRVMTLYVTVDLLFLPFPEVLLPAPESSEPVLPVLSPQSRLQPISQPFLALRCTETSTLLVLLQSRCARAGGGGGGTIKFYALRGTLASRAYGTYKTL